MTEIVVSHWKTLKNDGKHTGAATNAEKEKKKKKKKETVEVGPGYRNPRLGLGTHTLTHAHTSCRAFPVWVPPPKLRYSVCVCR